MSIIRRLRDMTLATFHQFLEHVEDPVKWIDHYLEEKTKILKQLETLYEQSSTHRQALQKEALGAAKMLQKREQQAKLALQVGEEELAKLALHEKLNYEEKYNKYRQLDEEAAAQMEILREQIQELRSDLQEVLEKRQYYLDRLQLVRVQQQLNERLGEREFARRLERLDRLEERISSMEEEALSLYQLRSKKVGGRR